VRTGSGTITPIWGRSASARACPRAFTVRALAGLVHVCGLLKRGHAGRATEAVRLYEDWEPRIID